MTKTIEVVVDASGQLRIDAEGFKGADCEDATRFLEDALGTVSERRRKPEYTSREQVARKQQVRR